MEDGLVGCLPARAFLAGSEHDGVVGLVRARDVHLGDQRVTGQVLPDCGAALDDPQHAGLNQGRHCPAPVRDEVVVDRVGLHDHDLALNEQLGEHVAGAERGHVAGGEHERRAGVAGRVGVGRGLAVGEGVLGDAGLHPDLGGCLGERDAVEGGGGEDLHAEPAVGRLAHGTRDAGLAVLGDVAQRVAVEPRHSDERPDAGEELLSRLGRARLEALGRDGCGQPVVLGGHGGRDHLLEQVGAVGRARLGPAGGVIGDEVDDRIERGRVDRRSDTRRGVGAGACPGAGVGLLGGWGHRPAARHGHESSSPLLLRRPLPLAWVGSGEAGVTGPSVPRVSVRRVRRVSPALWMTPKTTLVDDSQNCNGACLQFSEPFTGEQACCCRCPPDGSVRLVLIDHGRCPH